MALRALDIVPLLIFFSLLSLVLACLLEAFLPLRAVFGVCYVHIFTRPGAPFYLTKCVIHRGPCFCKTELNKCINATRMNTFMMRYTPMAQSVWNVEASYLPPFLNLSKADWI